MELSLRQKFTFASHLGKALLRQHHRELAPLLRQHLPPQGIVFDVGAHAGQFAKLFAELCPEGSVFAFEPGSYARAILSSVLGLRRIENVHLMPFGLGAAPATEHINVPIKASGSVGFGLSFVGDAPKFHHATRREPIFLCSIDAVMSALALPRLDLIKADIEGYELAMLEGGRDSLERHKPALMLELDDNSLARNGHSKLSVIDFLEELGYRPLRIDAGSAQATDRAREAERGSGDFLFLAEAS